MPGRLRAALPPYSDLLIGAILWACQMLLSAGLALYIRNRLETSHSAELAALYFFGALLAWPLALPCARFIAYRRRIETRFAAFFLALAAFTILLTAFLFAMDYRAFYSQWHAPFGSVTWAFQFVFTGASAVYQFSVLGLRLFMPLGLLCLFGTSFILAKRMR
ncbi:hypothetical protein FZ934_07150 [Rhizobium grahamii]|uniref:Uncharacterized protein n=1 Tax=Rhizobium grahamii TaxID=1120045 RepID=A0A5Q0C8E1_9HYPH|nr:MULTISPECIES: hypothetical protein [Rhizobium]QFY60227.1 hypothetical protein FZ934_07150 [Rhizobium grahamii]QRM50651.1 hypothetical protein F3Y33_15735 [Rhizobium sp. BG6]